jgi:hypothetical protein
MRKALRLDAARAVVGALHPGMHLETAILIHLTSWA